MSSGRSPPGLTTLHKSALGLAEAMPHSDYPLQTLLYSVVLHGFLRWRLPDYGRCRHLS
jgi:exodeoxyribonuclease V beta subunit